jgi:dipeptidyl-peptidase-4
MPAPADCLTAERLYASPALSGSSLRGIKMSPDGKRVAFLKGRDDDQYQLDLWQFDVADGSMRRLVDSKTLLAGKAITDAERARRERERTAMYQGISKYGWSPDGQRILAALGTDLYLIDVAHPETARVIASGDIIDPQISPKGRYVSFVRSQNLVVIDLKSGTERALTTDGGGTLHNAEAEFIAQEEMEQASGYWWAPDDSTIAYKRFDESTVPVVRRFEIQADRTDVIEQRYPGAGEANVLVSLAVVNAATGVSRAVDLGANQDIYLVRADWSADSSQLVYQRESRDQKRLDLVAVDKNTLAQRTLVTETSAIWIDLGGARPHFLKHRGEFIWQSERSGRKHLYLFDRDGKLLHPISQGEWGINAVLAVDEKAGRVFVESNREDPADMQVYALAIDGSTADSPQRLTAQGGWHNAEFSEHGEAFVDAWSDTDTPQQISVRRADGSMIGWLDHNEVNAAHPYARYKAAHVPTEFGYLKSADGQAMRYSLKRPLGFDPSHRYPVVIFVYGGPHAQLVLRHWESLREQFMAQHGYVVFTLDNRGSGRRERRFTDVIYGKMGKHEVEDQLVGIDWLAQQSFVDPKRIGVFGWSYGGFMALRMLSAASDRIAAGVAGAPVTDWSLYDTHYTERYLSRPQENPEGYKDSGVFAHLDGLRSPLLLMHGMADDNVLFVNSTRLMAELQKRGILFDLMTYPGAKHGLSTPANQTHMLHTIYKFFGDHFRQTGESRGEEQCH